jgi:peroxiredoxin
MKLIYSSLLLCSLFVACTQQKTETANNDTAKGNLSTTSAAEVAKNEQAVPNFTLPNEKDSLITLSEFCKGKKLVLIDFWASWCKPCRRENPNVVAAYSKYKSKGLDIISVSLDETKNNWVEAIKTDKLTWTNVSDLKYWDSEVAKLYQVQSIPTNFLVDSTGKLIAQDLRGIELQARLDELLK